MSGPRPCGDAARYDRGECACPTCGCPDADLFHAIALAQIGGPYENWPASGVLATPYDRQYEHTADFKDWGLAAAVATILNAVVDGRLVPRDGGVRA